MLSSVLLSLFKLKLSGKTTTNQPMLLGEKSVNVISA